MAIEYELTLAGHTDVEDVARRAFPQPAELPTGAVPLLSADLVARYGFGVTVLAEQDGYVEGESDDGMWTWEPGPGVVLSFRMDKFTDPTRNVTSMLTAVRRVLGTGPEDASLTLNSDVLLFVRSAGVVTKHRREWWSNYAGADAIIGG